VQERFCGIESASSSQLESCLLACELLADDSVFAPFQCDDGTLIDQELLCDLRPDCLDGSDETLAAGCVGFECGSGGQVIPEGLVCDENLDCENGADEPFDCESAACDGEVDCENGDDESVIASCQGFQCDNLRVIDADWECDGFAAAVTVVCSSSASASSRKSRKETR